MSSMKRRISIRPDDHDISVADEPIMEQGVEDDEVKGDIVEDIEGQEIKEMGEEQCHPVDEGENVDHGDVDEDAEEEHVAPAGLRDPGQPSPAERAEHSLTHIPYRPWCQHCVRGKAKGRQSRRIRGEQSESSCPRIRLDYCMITDKSQEQDDPDGDEEVAREPNAENRGEHAEGEAEPDDGDVDSHHPCHAGERKS